MYIYIYTLFFPLYQFSVKNALQQVLRLHGNPMKVEDWQRRRAWLSRSGPSPRHFFDAETKRKAWKAWENHGKMMGHDGKSWKKYGKTDGKMMENDGEMMENDEKKREMMGKLWGHLLWWTINNYTAWTMINHPCYCSLVDNSVNKPLLYIFNSPFVNVNHQLIVYSFIFNHWTFKH